MPAAQARRGGVGPPRGGRRAGAPRRRGGETAQAAGGAARPLGDAPGKRRRESATRGATEGKAAEQSYDFDTEAELLMRDFENKFVFDLDGNGELSEAEIEAGKRLMLDLYDYDGNGALDAVELEEVRAGLAIGKFGRSSWDLDVPDLETDDQIKLQQGVFNGAMAALATNDMCKAAMSVALVPMSAQFGWSASTAGSIQSAMFLGYLASQIPSSAFVAKYTGARALLIVVGVVSIGTAIAPAAASVSIAALCATRVVVGAGMGTMTTCCSDLISRWAATEDKSQSVAKVFGGFNIGRGLAFGTAPAVVAFAGWPAVFYTYAAVCAAWCLWWGLFTRNLPLPPRSTSTRRLAPRFKHPDEATGVDSYRASRSPAIMQYAKCTPFQCLFIAHFATNMLKFTASSWLPKYLVDVTGMSLAAASICSLATALASLPVGNLAARLADTLVEKKGWSLTSVRNLMQARLCFGGTAFFFGLACLLPATPAAPAALLYLKTALVLAGTTAAAFSLTGVMCGHQDICPRHASSMMTYTNSAGAISGVICVPLNGRLLDVTGSWDVALLWPAIAVSLVAAVLWQLMWDSSPVVF